MLSYSLRLIFTALCVGQVLQALLLLQCCPLAVCAAAWQSSLPEGVVRNTTLRGGQVLLRPLAHTCCRCTACDSFSLHPTCSRPVPGRHPAAVSAFHVAQVFADGFASTFTKRGAARGGRGKRDAAPSRRSGRGRLLGLRCGRALRAPSARARRKRR